MGILTRKIQAFSATLLFLAAFLPSSFADSELVLIKPSYQPEIVKNGSPSSSVPTAVTDPTTQFFGGKPLEISSEKEKLTEGEKKEIIDAGTLIGIQPGIGGEILGNSPVPIPTSSDSELKKSFRPVAYLLEEYGKIQQKMQEESLEQMVSMPQTKIEGVEALGETPLDQALKEKAVLEINLQVTEEVIRANEEFNLSKAHPLIDWLAMRGVSEENKEALLRAEAQRKAMAEAAKQAEKNGRRILFVVNGKIVPYFFNVPLFLKGDYHLYILSENDLVPQIAVE